MKKYFIKTFGCAMNFSDSERLASFLEKNSLETAKKIGEADFIIFNSCGVRKMAEDRAFGQIHNLKKNNPQVKIALTGCIAQRKDVQLTLAKKVDLFFAIKDSNLLKNFIIKNLLEIRNSKLEIAELNKASTQESIAYLSLTAKYSNFYTANVPIMTGCNNFCAYCVVPYARGREASRPHTEIVKEVTQLIESGCKEIILLGQNVNSYRSPSASGRGVMGEGVNFSQLLKMINKIPGNFWIRFLSSHPKDMTAELITTITSLDKVCENIHLPIQSGDNNILKNMNRQYTRQDYLHTIDFIKKSFQKNKPAKLYSLSTDVIVGFPGETKNQFENSAKVMRKVAYDMAYFGQFSPRPQTAAWKMKDNITKTEKERREKYLNEILKKTALQSNKKYINTIQDVLIEKEKDGFYFGKTRTFKNVKVTSASACHPEPVEESQLNKQKSLIGKIIPVKITRASTWNLEACLPYVQRKIYKKNLPNKISTQKKIIVILGPTASGKSSTAIKLAKKFNGEIISADSRQIYRGMDVGTGKVAGSLGPVIPSLSRDLNKNAVFLSEGIPHYMLDIVNPQTPYNAAKFKKKSLQHIEDILNRGKTPIICGGTGFWIKAIMEDVNFPQVKPDWKLREKLEKISTEKLFQKLEKLDIIRAKNIDRKNKVRLIRAIEICQKLGQVPPEDKKENIKYTFLQLGIKRTKEELHERIKLNVTKRLQEGMIEEVAELHKKGISWKRLRSFGLSYSLVPDFLKGIIETKEELSEKVYLAEKNYAKRQMTWFQKDKKIKWIKDYKEIEKEVKIFLSSTKHT